MKKFLLGPRLGDVLHSLYIVKSLADGEKADVYLSDHIPYMGNYFTFGLDATFNDIYSTVMKQPYVNTFSKHNGEEDLIDLRTFNINYDYLYKVNWYDSYKALYNVGDKYEKERWLCDIDDKKYDSYKDKVIINFSDGRYCPNYDEVLENIVRNNKCIFIYSLGDKRGYDNFKYKDLLFDYKNCESFHEMYSIIEKCKFYVGNQTMPLALAHGLFKPHIGFLYKNDAIHYKDNYNKNYFWIDNKKRTSENFNKIYNFIKLDKMKLIPDKIGYNNPEFKVNYDFEFDSVSISCDSKIDVNILIFDVDSNGEQQIINCNYASFDNSAGWFGSVNRKKFKEMDCIKVQITDDEVMLKEDIKIVDKYQYLFDIKYVPEENKLYVSSQTDLSVNVAVYESDISILNSDIKFEYNTFWFLVTPKSSFRVEIKDGEKILKEEIIKIKEVYREPKKSTVSLSIIVKDEAPTILMMLNSVLPIIDYYIVVDTGSSDGTQDVVRNFFKEKGIPGEVIESPFNNFGYARNVALNATKGKADYAFWIDADDKLLISPKFDVDKFKSELYKYDGVNISQVNKFQYFSDEDFHENTISGNKLTFFFSTTKEWRWWGPVHEVLICDDPTEVTHSNDLLILKCDVGDSWKEGRKKYERYAKILENYLKEDYNSRWVFYTAQCYLDAGMEENALHWYKKRIEMVGYWEETYYAVFKIAEIKARLGYSMYEVIDSYLQCGKTNMHRVEHLIPIIEHYQYIGEYDIAYLYSSFAMKYAGKSPEPISSLFIDSSVYNWRIYDLHNLSCWWSGRQDEAKETFKKLLEQVNKGLVPQDQVSRILENKKFNIDE